MRLCLLLFGAFIANACVMGSRGVAVGPAGGIVMAYEVTGRVTSDQSNCATPMADVSVALFDMNGALLDETRTDSSGKFNVTVRNPDAAEGMVARLDGDDPTVQVALRVQANGSTEARYTLRLPRPILAKEYRVRLDKKDSCKE
ncbi:MAG: carboxypeptidase regulatory-like domain-containing protein [Deltaproteobacteria bacterium]|nr:carboxypeptidase regulatory-like domain-containing protein [Deltaproteobacteria bacterium]